MLQDEIPYRPRLPYAHAEAWRPDRGAAATRGDVGNAANLTADRRSPLLLAVNDCCSLADNAGAFSVTLVRYAD